MGGGGIEVREWAERTGDILVFRLPSGRLVVGTQSKSYGPGGTLGISGWGCAAGTLEPLTTLY